MSRVVVGYDGRRPEPRVLERAAAEAARRRLPLSVITLVHSPDEVASTTGRPADGWRPRAVVRRRLAEAVEQVHRRFPDLRVATECLTYAEVDGDREPFASCAVLVLGECRGREETPGPVTPTRVLVRAVTCPVVVVGAPEPAR